MRKNILYIIAIIAFVSCCKPTGTNNDVFVCGVIKTDTMYHIAAIDGDLIYYDTIRIETRQFPDHYIHYTGWDTYVHIVGSDTLTNNECRAKYCAPVHTYTYAHADTITNIHTPGFYNEKHIGAWALRQILVTGYKPSQIGNK